MDEKLEQAIKEYMEKARKLPPTKEKVRIRSEERGSLHQIIKTKEQAERFMKQLRALQ
jgi:hypothetical protein